MKRQAFTALAFALALKVMSAAPALSQTAWIHVEVDETDEDSSHVRVNLPLSVVEVALDAAPSKFVSEGRIHLHHVDEDINVADLRRMWAELKDAGDAEFVSVEGRDGNIAVRREGDIVRIDVTDHDDDGDTVHVEVPVSVVDALFSGEGEELDIKNAVRELKSRRGDIVRVQDGDTKVRVWIDERD